MTNTLTAPALTSCTAVVNCDLHPTTSNLRADRNRLNDYSSPPSTLDHRSTQSEHIIKPVSNVDKCSIPLRPASATTNAWQRTLWYPQSLRSLFTWLFLSQTPIAVPVLSRNGDIELHISQLVPRAMPRDHLHNRPFNKYLNSRRFDLLSPESLPLTDMLKHPPTTAEYTTDTQRKFEIPMMCPVCRTSTNADHPIQLTSRHIDIASNSRVSLVLAHSTTPVHRSNPHTKIPSNRASGN
jgi:hypothetical protein